MLIRPATPDDLPAIRALERSADTAAHWAEREYDALFAADSPRRVALVVVDESGTPRINGFVIARCSSGEWEIENVVVVPDRQRQGIATEMVRDLVERAHASGATSVLLEVRESNLAARQLYKRVGFSQQGRRSNYYRDPPEDALLLQICFPAGAKVP